MQLRPSTSSKSPDKGVVVGPHTLHTPRTLPAAAALNPSLALCAARVLLPRCARTPPTAPPPPNLSRGSERARAHLELGDAASAPLSDTLPFAARRAIPKMRRGRRPSAAARPTRAAALSSPLCPASYCPRHLFPPHSLFLLYTWCFILCLSIGVSFFPPPKRSSPPLGGRPVRVWLCASAGGIQPPRLRALGPSRHALPPLFIVRV